MSNSNEQIFFAPEPLTDKERAQLPIFPLPTTVLFPHTFVPLHIFEPRYRTMVQAALRDGGSLGIVMLLTAEQQSEARPPVHKIAGAGRIVHHSELADGRFMILLRGIERITLLEELAPGDEPFRRFRTEPLNEIAMEAKPSAQALATLQSCVNQLAVTMTEGGAELLKAVSMANTPGALADLLASALIGEPETQQKLLETTDAKTRVDRVLGTIAELLLNLPKIERSDDRLMN